MTGHQATLFDGERAMPMEVRFHVADGMLHVLNAAKELLIIWPVAEVRAEALSGPEACYRLQLDGNDNDARLIIAAADYDDVLRPLAPGLRRFLGIRLATIRLSALVVSPAVAIVLALIFGFSAISSGMVDLVPRSWEISLGQSLREDWLTRTRACGSQRANHITQNLVGQLTLRAQVGFPVKVTFIDVPANNAFTLPGGQIFMTRGLLDDMEGMDEFAGVLAHEMGHVSERHGLRNLIAASGIQLLASVTAGGDLISGVGGALTVLSYSRSAEREADAFAAVLLRDSGIGTGGLVRWFERLRSTESLGVKASDQIPAIFSTHPTINDRADRLLQLDPDGTAKSTPDSRWPVIRAVCDEG